MAKIENVRAQTKFGTANYELYRPVVPRNPSFLTKLAEACLTTVLFGAHRMYRVRLQNARVQGTIYLADFRELLGNFLAEWSGKSQYTCSGGILMLTRASTDSNLLVSRVKFVYSPCSSYRRA